MLKRNLLVLMVFAFASLLMAETIGPFTSTAASGVAPQCNTPVIFQRFPGAAFGKTVYLAVWADGERKPKQKSTDIYCARIDSATGQSLDPNGILICSADYNQSHPMVAFDGTNFLVVWEDMRSHKDYDIYGARVSESGQVLDPEGFPITANRDTNEVRPAIGFANGNYFVAWSDARRYPVYGIWGARITPEGRVLDSNGILLDCETQAVINAAKPATGRWNNSKENWWNGLKTNSTVSISSSTDGCNVAWINCNTSDWHFKNLMLCRINAATGQFVIAPKKITQAYNHVADVAAHCVTPGGIAIGIDFLRPGWGSTPTFFCQRFDSTLMAKDTLWRQASTYIFPQPRAFTYDIDAGPATNVRGQPSLLKFAAAFDGKNIVNALEGYWWKTSKTTISRAIILLRSSLTQDTLLDLSSPVFVDLTTRALGVSGPGDVCWPYLTPGPNSTCLLLYEKDNGINNRQVVCRVLREN